MKTVFSGLPNRLRSKNPILVIDRFGLIGESLSLKLSDKFPVVFVGKKSLDQDEKNQKIIYIPFSEKFPAIPDEKYSHIIFVDEEGLDLELLPKIIKEVKAINADFIFAQGLSSKTKYMTDEIYKLDRSAKVVLFGDIFANKLILRKNNFKSTINNYIYQAQNFGKIQVLGDGLRETYPVFLQDVISGLVDLVRKLHKADSLFYIFPKYPPFELSLAHMIQKMNPEITIDFIKDNQEFKTIPYPPNGKYLLSDKYPLSKIIRNIDIKRKVKTRDADSSKHASLFKKFFVFTFWTLIFLLFAPFIFAVFFSFLGSGTLYFAREEMNRGNFANVKSSLHFSQTLYSLGEQASSVLLQQAKFAGFKSGFSKFSQDINTKYQISQGLLQAFNSGEYFSKVMNGKSKNPISDFIQGENYLKSSIIVLNKAKIEGGIPKPILQNLGEITPLIKFLSNIVDVMPKIFGMEGPKTYLILFQDNAELRPGGGVINLYGILKFNLGKITEFSINDVSSVDQQLRGHVEPPFAIRRYLKEEHWYVRDSNFDVDFVKSALVSSNLMFAEAGQKIDGVIAIDTSFIKDILHAIGQISLTNYNKIINENNFDILMQSDVQKNSFFKSLNKAIIEKIAGNKVNYFLIAQAISDSLMQKHLMLEFSDLQNIFTVNGWSSSLWDEREANGGSVNDFLGINEANLGLNKVDYYILRQVFQKVIIENNGGVSEELEIDYKNQDTVSRADYKNYLRIILPENTTLSEISINGNSQNIVDAITDPLIYEEKNFKAPNGLEVEKTNEESRKIFGFLIKVPAGENTKIKLKYILAENISESNAFSYNLKLFKQPGVDSFPYSFSLVYPNSLSIVKNSDGINNDGKLTYFGKITEDKNIVVSFVRK
jgi:hypothetical protein